jgi:N-acetylglucosaminyldiphosphoundecaprenol N-acetyl-beta-D-mannosaminyltransferase
MKGMTVSELELDAVDGNDVDTVVERDTTKALVMSATNFDRDVYCVFGVPIDVMSVERALFELREASYRRVRCFLSTPNLNFLIGSHKDEHFRNAVICSDMSLADGMPIVWLARLIGVQAIERVAGSTLFERLAEDSLQAMSVYFFGGGEGAGQLAASRLNTEGKGLRCVGYRYPGFGSIDEMSQSETINDINRCAPDFLVVALGAKKGQAWLQRNQKHLTVPIISHLGAVVNMAAGTIMRAPRWMQVAGLEWLWRIKEEPALWRRYFGDGMNLLRLFIFYVTPCVVYLKAKPGRAVLEKASVKLRRFPERTYIQLRGPRDLTNLAPVREAMRDATIADCDVVVSFRDVDYVDSAFLGLCLVLYGHQLKIGRTLAFEGGGPKLRKIFRAHCVEYLLDAKVQAQTQVAAPTMA